MPNITLNYNKWSKLLSAVSAHKLFSSNLTNHQMTILLAPVCTLAFALGHFYKKTIKDGFHIAVAGADSKETIAAGSTYRLLATLLGIDHIKVDLVGPEVDNDIYNSPALMLRQGIGQNVNISIHKMTIGAYAKENTPDVIMLNHPGFEAHFEEWFVPTELEFVVDREIPILGTSYANDEAELDAFFLQAYGFKASEPINNPYLMDHTKQPCDHEDMDFGSDAAKMGLFNWGGQVWCIEKKSKRDEDQIEFLKFYLQANSRLAGQLDDPSALPVIVDAEDQHGNDWVLIRMLPEPIFYSRDKSMIVSGHSNQVIAEDIELDCTYLKPKHQKSYFQSLLISAIINRDYAAEIDEFIEDEMEQFEDFFQSMLPDEDSQNEMIAFIEALKNEKTDGKAR